MKNVSAAVKVGVLFLILVVGGYAVWKTVGERPSGESEFELWAKFHDASGLPKGSRVVIAGLPVGQISDLAIQGRYARITMRVRDNIPIYSNAIVFKKSSSLLGDYYLEIDPGTPQSVTAEGKTIENRRLESGDEIKRVVEATSPDELIRRIEESLPNVDAVLVSVRDLSEDLRSVVNGPLRSMASRLDKLVQDQAGTVESILTRTDKALARIDRVASDIERHTASGGSVDEILDNLNKASADAQDLVASAKDEVQKTGEKVRAKLDLVDEVLDRTSSVMTKVDEDKGTLGRLVNDSTIADNVEDITDEAKGFLGSLFGMQTYVGLRSEYYLHSGFNNYVTLELRTRPDKFYYIEFERSGRGAYPDTSLVYDPGLGRYRQDVTIKDKLRFTFQFARQFDWLTLRYGIKESTGGIGADARWFNDRLQVSTDLFDASFDSLPRLKVSAAYQFFGFLYVLAGVDDILNPPDRLDIEKVQDSVTASGDPVPEQFDHFRFGRDAFFGAMVRFNDVDLTALLTVGGAAILGAVD